jgi:hypothetical protein
LSCFLFHALWRTLLLRDVFRLLWQLNSSSLYSLWILRRDELIVMTIGEFYHILFGHFDLNFGFINLEAALQILSWAYLGLAADDIYLGHLGTRNRPWLCRHPAKYPVLYGHWTQTTAVPFAKFKGQTVASVYSI